MGTRRKPKKTETEFDLDAFSAGLEEMAATDKPAPPPKESELLKVVREKYDLLKIAIVVRHRTYKDICDKLVETGLEQGVYTRALKDALVKVAIERGEIWDDGRPKPKPKSDQTENQKSNAGTRDHQEKDQKSDERTHIEQLSIADAPKAGKFVEVPVQL
jgi:hypothetical protein